MRIGGELRQSCMVPVVAGLEVATMPARPNEFPRSI